MANSLLITKLSDGSFSFVVNGETVNTIINLRNDLTTVGNEAHFKTSEGANLIKLQQILFNEVTIFSGSPLPVASSPLDLRIKLRSVGFWDWMNSGGSGSDRFDELLDTFEYFGNDGKVPMVDESQLKLIPFSIPDTSYLNLFPKPLIALKGVRVNSLGTAYEFYDVVNTVTQFIRPGFTETSPSEDVLNSALALKANISDYNDRFKGKYSSLSALQATYPTANDGDYAIVDPGSGSEAKEYIWDSEEGWVMSGSTAASTTDALPEGSTNLYFTSARVLSTVLSGLSVLVGGSIVSTDSIIIAFGKIQKQINDALISIGLKQDLLVSGTNIKTVNYGNLLGSGNLPIQFMNATAFEAYGDSITVGMNSSPSSNSYVNLTASLYNKIVTNRAVSARGIWEATKQHFANISPSSTVLGIVMAGFNDVRRGGSATKTRNKIMNGYKSIIANHFLSSFIGANTSSTSITRSGTWNVYTGIAVGGKTNTGSYSSINGNYIEYSFTDNNVVVGLIGGDGVSQIHANFTVLIDGVSQGSFTENNQTDGISDGNNDNARAAMNLIFTGLSEGSHTIRLTNTTSNALIVDFFGHLKQPKFCYPILIMKAPKMDATGYATVPNLANDTVIDQLNTDIETVVASFPSDYPIVIGDTNAYYNISTGLDPADHIHPNNVGHRQIYKAAYTALRPLLMGGSGSAVVDATTTVKGIIKLAGDLSGTADLPTVPSLLNKLNITSNTSLSGTGLRMMEAIADGTPIATAPKYQMKVTDSDVISAIVGGTYSGGIATIVPSGSKVMLEGQVYQSTTYFYRAYSDNVVLRISLV